MWYHPLSVGLVTKVGKDQKKQIKSDVKTLVQIEPFFNYWNFLEQYKSKMGLQSQNKNL